jgi:methylglutaconyl-CoA hydratase
LPETITVKREQALVRIALNRPHVRNAIDAVMIAELADIFEQAGHDKSARAIVLQGEGAVFCGGADVNYMRAGLELGEQENYRDALRLSDMFAAIDACAVPVVARVQGAALGGGVGLLAVVDIVVAAQDTVFGFTEGKLGIVPAVISPFVVRKIGASQARALFTTAERFDAERALRIGLIHEVTTPQRLDEYVEGKIKELMSCGPLAARVAKDIARNVGGIPLAEARAWTARRIAERRASEEGQEGLRAFLEKRKPAWQ